MHSSFKPTVITLLYRHWIKKHEDFHHIWPVIKPYTCVSDVLRKVVHNVIGDETTSDPTPPHAMQQFCII